MCRSVAWEIALSLVDHLRMNARWLARIVGDASDLCSWQCSSGIDGCKIAMKSGNASGDSMAGALRDAGN
jgi:hypothetical protein